MYDCVTCDCSTHGRHGGGSRRFVVDKWNKECDLSITMEIDSVEVEDNLPLLARMLPGWIRCSF